MCKNYFSKKTMFKSYNTLYNDELLSFGCLQHKCATLHKQLEEDEVTLQVAHTIKSLVFWGYTKYEGISLSEKEVNTIAEIIMLGSLKYINLKDNYIDDERTKIIFDALGQSNVVSLDLSNNWGHDNMRVNAIAKFMMKSSLRYINLRGNLLDEEGAKIIFKAVCQSNVVSLDLSNNNIELNDIKTIKDITTSIGGSGTLSYLNLSDNFIGSEWMPFLTRAMFDSKSLIFIDLSWNRFLDSDGTLVSTTIFGMHKVGQFLHFVTSEKHSSSNLEMIQAVLDGDGIYNEQLIVKDYISNSQSTMFVSPFQYHIVPYSQDYKNHLVSIFKVRSLLGIEDHKANFLTDALICTSSQYPSDNSAILHLHYSIIDIIGRFIGFEEVSNIARRGIDQLKIGESFFSHLDNTYIKPYIQKIFLPSKEMAIQKFADKHGIAVDVQTEGLRYCYKKIVLAVHPDKTHDDGINMRELNEICYGSHNRLLEKLYTDISSNLHKINIATKVVDTIVDSTRLYNDMSLEHFVKATSDTIQLFGMCYKNNPLVFSTSAVTALYHVYEEKYWDASTVVFTALGYGLTSLLLKSSHSLSMVVSVAFTTLSAFATLLNVYDLCSNLYYELPNNTYDDNLGHTDAWNEIYGVSSGYVPFQDNAY